MFLNMIHIATEATSNKSIAACQVTAFENDNDQSTEFQFNQVTKNSRFPVENKVTVGKAFMDQLVQWYQSNFPPESKEVEAPSAFPEDDFGIVGW